METDSGVVPHSISLELGKFITKKRTMHSPSSSSLPPPARGEWGRKGREESTAVTSGSQKNVQMHGHTEDLPRQKLQPGTEAAGHTLEGATCATLAFTTGRKVEHSQAGSVKDTRPMRNCPSLRELTGQQTSHPSPLCSLRLKSCEWIHTITPSWGARVWDPPPQPRGQEDAVCIENTESTQLL